MNNYFHQEVQFIDKKISRNFWDNSKVLITGASGVIGNTLSLYFIYLIEEVGLNIELTLVSKTGIFPCKIDLSKRINFVTADLCKEDFYQKSDKFNFIFHLAGYGQPNKFTSDPFSTIMLNTYGTRKLLNMLAAQGNFIYLSSSEVYSGLKSGKCSEVMVGSTNTDHPRAAYIQSKKTGEAICFSAMELYSFKVKALRLALAYGPGIKIQDGRVMYELIERGIRERKIIVKSGGSSIRTYCYIRDAVHQILEVTIKGQEVVYNIGGISKITINELANLIGKKLNIKSELNFVKEIDIGAPNQVELDLSKTLKLIENPEFIDFDEGLDRTINWIKKII